MSKNLLLSKKGQRLIDYYKNMVHDGYENDLFNLKFYKSIIKEKLTHFNIESVLDYGSGRSDWYLKSFDKEKNLSAKDFFNLKSINLFEPSLDIDSRKKSDCVICFDVLEHVFVGDLTNVLSNIFENAKKLVIIQVACYPAKAILPNGENAHITVRNPLWWKGMLDSVSLKFKDISVVLMCSTEYKKTILFKTWSGNEWMQSKKFVTGI